MTVASLVRSVARTAGTPVGFREQWLRMVTRSLSPTASAGAADGGGTADGHPVAIRALFAQSQADSLMSGVPPSGSIVMRKTLSGVRSEPVTLDDVELPPHLEEWLSQIVGSIKTSFTFDPDTYFDTEKDLYGED